MLSKSSQITTLEALQREQFIVRERIKFRQEKLKSKMHQIPGELAAAGVNSFIPKILRGKVTNAALNGGKKLLNHYFAPENKETRNLVSGSTKTVGLLSGLKSVVRLIRGK